MGASYVAGGGWSTLVAVIVIVGLLGAVLFVAGRPNDVAGKLRWQVWVIGALVMIGLIFLLSRGVQRLDYNACRDTTRTC